MPLADSEIVFGAFTEYTGLRFAFFLLAEYAGIVVMSLLFAVLYLGGWAGPLEPWLGWVWTLLKGFVVAVVVIWLRVSWPRMREDQLQRLAWVWLVPASSARPDRHPGGAGLMTPTRRVATFRGLSPSSGHVSRPPHRRVATIRGLDHIERSGGDAPWLTASSRGS